MTIRKKGHLLMMASGKYYNWFRDKYIHRWSNVYPDCLRNKGQYDQSCLTTDLIELKPSATITVEGLFGVSGNADTAAVFDADFIKRKEFYTETVSFDYRSNYKYIMATVKPENYANLKIYQDDTLIFDGEKNPPKPET